MDSKSVRSRSIGRKSSSVNVILEICQYDIYVTLCNRVVLLGKQVDLFDNTCRIGSGSFGCASMDSESVRSRSIGRKSSSVNVILEICQYDIYVALLGKYVDLFDNTCIHSGSFGCKSIDSESVGSRSIGRRSSSVNLIDETCQRRRS